MKNVNEKLLKIIEKYNFQQQNNVQVSTFLANFDFVSYEKNDLPNKCRFIVKNGNLLQFLDIEKTENKTTAKFSEKEIELKKRKSIYEYI